MESGGVQPLEGGENDLEIENLARFAVNEHNKKEYSSRRASVHGRRFCPNPLPQNALLQFKRVVNVKQQVVAGLMYYITTEVLDCGKTKLYEAKVWVKLWENFQNLEEFKFIGDVN